jgi:hypothetical protein
MQQRIVDLFKDGIRHSVDEIANVIDKYATAENVRNHISVLRKILNPIGYDIVCETRYKRTTYRMVMMIYQEGE